MEGLGYKSAPVVSNALRKSDQEEETEQTAEALSSAR
jgi:hypothetical protein